MSIDKLIEDGSIHPFRATPEEIRRAMDIARRDIALAESILDESLDWSYSIAYNAVLQACRAYMFHQEYRPTTSEAHKATLAFMQIAVEEPIKKTVSYFDRVRKKRHRAVYDEVGLVSEKEARQLLKKAREFISYIKDRIGT